MGNNSMGLLGAISYIIGNIVGSGIFITPGSILNDVGSVGTSLIVWIVSALISILGAFCYVELGTSIRKSGADYAYLCYVKWYSVAFSFMCVGCILMYPATLAVQAGTFSEYIIRGTDIKFASEASQYWCSKLLSFSLTWLLLFMNFFSVKKFVSKFQIIATLAKVISAAIIIGTGFYFLIFKGKTESLQNFFDGSVLNPGKLTSGLFSGLFSYDGWDIINFGMEEVENPKRTMPLAIIISMIIVALIYLAMNIAYLAVLTPDQMKLSTAVAVDFAENSLGYFKYAIPFIVAIVLIGTLNSTMFSASRYLYAASREGHLPAFISCINKYHDSPRVALIIHVIIAMIFSFVGDLNDLIQYVSFAQWLHRVFTMIALIYIRFANKPIHPNAIKTPIILPFIFLFVCAMLTFNDCLGNWKNGLATGGLLLGGFLVYIGFIWEKTLNRFPWYQNFAKKVNTKTAIVSQIAFNGMIDQGLVDDQDPATGTLDEDTIRKRNIEKSMSAETEGKKSEDDSSD